MAERAQTVMMEYDIYLNGTKAGPTFFLQAKGCSSFTPRFDTSQRKSEEEEELKHILKSNPNTYVYVNLQWEGTAIAWW